MNDNNESNNNNDNNNEEELRTLLAEQEFLSLDWVQPHEDALAKQPQQLYAVQRWVDYLGAVDEQLLEVTTATTTTKDTKKDNDNSNKSDRRAVLLAARDWVGRRAVSHLPRSHKLWKLHWEFVLARQQHPPQRQQPQQIAACFERCLATLSRHPRVWMEYIGWLMKQQPQQQPPPPQQQGSGRNNNTLVVAVMDYTVLRRTINRAFQSVAVQQHQKLWDVIADPLLELDYNNNSNNIDDDNSSIESKTLLQWLPWDSANRLLQRYCQFRPQFRVEYAAWCERHGRWGAAAAAYQELLNDSASSSSSSSAAAAAGAPSQSEQHWQSFCELVAQHSESCEAAGIPWEAILQTAIRQQREEGDNGSRRNRTPEDVIAAASSSAGKSNTATTMLGLLYSWLASAWIQRGSFDMARTVYEEGLLTVRTVRDFSILYAAYLQLEEGLLTAITDRMEENDDGDDDGDDANVDDAAAMDDGHDAAEDEDWDLLLATGGASSAANNTATAALAELELAVARAEHLTNRRPLLLNAVKLRQNPNDCAGWIERANLYCQADQPRQAVSTLEEALQTVGTVAAAAASSAALTAPLSHVVLRLVKVYEESMRDVTAARDLLDRVCRQRSTALGLARAEELAECWATWVELELKHEAWDEALSLARQSVARDVPVRARHRRGKLHLTRSLRLWDLLLDLEESLGTVQTTKDAYNRAVETKVATVQHVLNFGAFLTEQKYFEESLTAYERGVELFAFPHAGAKLLWKAYLEAFLKRYKGTKVERARNLFQRCLDGCPAEECVDFFTMNGEFEEEFGLTKRALSVYRSMCEKVPADEKYDAYQLYVAKTEKYLGLPATREIYQEAIEKLSKDPVSAVKMCRDFAKMEIGLQQVDRARAIYAYGAQLADPRRMPEYWKDWNDFEIANGNEETFREMLRIKRSVEAAFSTINYNAAGMNEKVENFSNEEAMKVVASAEGIELDETNKSSAVSGFVPSKRMAAAANLHDVEERVAKLRKATGAADEEKAVGASSDDDEIDLDDIDAEIEEAAAEGEEAALVPEIQNVSTKAIPDAVFGGLAAQKAERPSL